MKLSSVEYSEGLKYSLGSDGTYYTVSGIGTCTDTEILIPPSYNGLPVKAIGADAFYECVELVSIVIPDGVTNIGTYAFYGCSALTSIAIPDGVGNIDECAFDNCSALVSITIPNGVESICNLTFADCSGL